MNLITSLIIGLLFGVGVFQLLQRNIIRSAIGLVIVSNAMNLLLLASGAYQGMVVAYSTAQGVRSDALPQALVLTAIVISMGGLSFTLAMLYVLVMRRRSADASEMNELRH